MGFWVHPIMIITILIINHSDHHPHDHHHREHHHQVEQRRIILPNKQVLLAVTDRVHVSKMEVGSSPLFISVHFPHNCQITKNIFLTFPALDRNILHVFLVHFPLPNNAKHISFLPISGTLKHLALRWVLKSLSPCLFWDKRRCSSRTNRVPTSLRRLMMPKHVLDQTKPQATTQKPAP